MTELAFRLVDAEAEADLDLVYGWMQQPHVAEWWDLAGPAERVREYLRAGTRPAHRECWIVSDDRRPFAYVETYVVADDPLAAHYDAEAGDRGFELLIGPPELLGTGAAQRVVRHLVTFLLGQFGITRIVCAPDVRNVRMLALCRALGGEQIAMLELGARRVALIAWTKHSRVPRSGA